MFNSTAKLPEQRRQIRSLLNGRKAVDAIASYFAFYHPDERTQLLVETGPNDRAVGYVAMSRTSIDLFRPFVTLRLPIDDMQASVDLIYEALLPDTAVILNAPFEYAPLLRALFTIQQEETLWLLELDQQRYEPIVNVLVSRSDSPRGLPRFIIRNPQPGQDEVVAAASLNWQSPDFAEIAVMTQPGFQRRGWGRSVVSAMVGHLLENGRSPLYVTAAHNETSRRLAEAVGFVDKGVRQVLIQGVLRPRP